MRRLILLLMLFVMSLPVWAADYYFGPGDEFGSLSLYDYDTLLMAGGEGHTLNVAGWSTATIEDTNPIIGEGDGGIWELGTYDYGELTILGGEINDLGGHHESLIYLFGGQILGSLTVYNETSWVHIYGYGFNNDPFLGSPLTGFWADDTAFSINLVDDTISTYDQIIFHEIPEPASIVLLGLGMCLLRNHKIS